MRNEFSPDVRRAIAETAYFIAERQGFVPGRELDNWLSAEREIVGELLDARTGQRIKPRTNGNAARPANRNQAAPPRRTVA